MARTILQIEDGMIASINAIDPGIDARKGPIRAAFVQPQAQVIQESEILVDDLSLRYSLQYVRTKNPDVIELYCYNHGIARGTGSPSKGVVIFFTSVQPPAGSSILIPQGTTVTTQDQTVSFQTVADTIVDSETFPVLFNSATRRYEIPVDVESIGIGPEFEIAANRLQVLISPIEGIQGVTQTTPTGASQPIESNEQLATRQQAKFVGLGLGSTAGVESIVRDFDPARILDVSVVYSTELDLFRRPTRRPAFDVYLVGHDNATTTDTFTAIGGETSFVLSLQPVSAITSVTLNGNAVTSFELVQDSTPATSFSARSTDKIVLGTPLVVGDVLAVQYSYDKLIQDTQDFIVQSNKRLWQADILVRQAIPVALTIVIEITALSTLDPERALVLAQQATFTTVNLNQMGLVYYPNAVLQNITATIAGLSNIAVRTFQRQDQLGVLPVDVVETARNEFAFVDSSALTINIRTL